MKKRKIRYAILCFSIFMLIFPFSISARMIWRIGNDDKSSNEFGLPGSPGSDPALKQEIVSFSPPKDPNSYDWQSFPCKIWPKEASLNPKEIRIIYEYPKDFRCPILRIKARSDGGNVTQGLNVIKGGVEISQDLGLLSNYPNPNTIPEIPLGNIRKGLHEDNIIIIKNASRTEGNYSIFFDYLELDDQDQDQDADGSLDCEEIEGDIDEDGTENALDSDTATLFIQSLDPAKSKHVTLDIQEQDNRGPYFTGLSLLDANSPHLLRKPPEFIFFPFRIFRAQINVSDNSNIITVLMYTSEDEIIHEAAQFYLYEENEWNSIPFDIISHNSLSISIELNNRQDIEKEVYNNEFSITGGLGYKKGLGIDFEKTGNCYIKSLLRR